MTTALTLKKHARGDYRTADGRWRCYQPWLADNGLQHRWIIQWWDPDVEDNGDWLALDDDWPTLREARAALAEEIANA